MSSRLTSKEEKWFLETLRDPVKWARHFLRDPRDPEKTFDPRSYQEEVLRASPNEKYMVLRFGRRSGKTVIICSDTLWHATAKPLIDMLDDNRKTQKRTKILVLAPMDVHIKEIFDTYMAMIEGSQFVSEMITKIRRSDISKIEFSNGSWIKGMTIGISTANKGLSARGQGCNYLFLDEVDYIPEDVMDQAIMPVTTDNPFVKVRACSTPSGKRGKYFQWCFPRSTQVNTPQGLTNIENIKINDKVFSIDGKQDKVTKLYKQHYDGNLSVIKTPAGMLKCTPNHELYIYGKGFICANDVKIGDYIGTPKEIYPKVDLKLDFKSFYFKYEYKRIKEYSKYKEIGNKTKASEIIYGNKHNRSLLHYYEKSYKKYGELLWPFDERRRKNILKAETFLNNINNENIDIELLYKFIGYYLAKGNILKHTYDNIIYYGGIRLTFNEKETKYIEEIKSISNTLFPNSKITIVTERKDRSTSINIMSSWLSYVFITLCGEYSYKKKINNAILSNSKYTKYLLDGFINGDGCKASNNKYSISTTSKSLAYQLYSICISNNIPATISKSKKKGHRHDVYTIRQLFATFKYKIDDKLLYHRIDKIFSEYYNDCVYNLETKRTHTYNVENMCVHNCTDHKKLGWWHSHVPSWHLDNANWLSIKQAEEQGLPKEESTEWQMKNTTTSDSYAREYGAEFGEELAGVYKHDHLDACLVKYCKDYKDENVDIFNPGFQQNPNNLYIIGVDWNTYIHGGQILILEFCKNPTFVEYFDDKLNKDVKIDFTNRFRIFYRIGIKSEEATQRKTRDEILRLLKEFKIDHVYVDYGAGDTNIEELTNFGKKHPEYNISRKLHVVDSGSSIDHYDPLLRQKVKKRVKSMMVNISVVSVEEGRVLLPKEEDNKHRLVNQMRGYTIKTVTTRGDFTYNGEDHILDAFHLAMYGFATQFSILLVNKLSHTTIGFLPNPRIEVLPNRQQEVKSPVTKNTSMITRDPEIEENKKYKLPVFTLPKRSRKSNILGGGFRKLF